MIRRPPRSTRTDNSFPTRRSSDLFERWRRLINDAAARDTLSGFPGYAQIKLRGAADVLSGVVCRLLDYPYHCSHGYFVRTLVRLWLARLEGPLDGRASDALEGRSDGDGLSEAQRALLEIGRASCRERVCQYV